MENKSVVITGGSRGIGRACALLFASKGYNVLIGYNKNREAAEAVLADGENIRAQIRTAAGEMRARCMEDVAAAAAMLRQDARA